MFVLCFSQFMSTDQPTAAPTANARPEPDYAPDEAMLLLIEMQMRDLIKLRRFTMELAEDIAVNGRGKSDATTGIALKGIGKLILQICAMEQHTARLRAGEQVALKAARTRAKKEQVKREVSAVLEAADAGAVGAGAVDLKVPSAVRNVKRQSLLRDVFQSYDFSDPRTVAAMVADICQKVGFPFQAETWPALSQPVTAPAPPIQTSEPAESPKPPAKPPSPSPSRPTFNGSSVSSIGLMAQMPPVPTPPKVKGRGPP